MSRLLVFRLDDRLYALRVECVERVLHAAAATPVPETSPLILGVLNVGGTVLPVLSMRVRLGVEGRAMQLSDRLVIARASNRTVALLVDSVVGVVEYGAEDLVDADSVMPGIPYIESVVRRGEETVLILADAFSAQEEAALEEALARHRAPQQAASATGVEAAEA